MLGGAKVVASFFSEDRGCMSERVDGDIGGIDAHGVAGVRNIQNSLKKALRLPAYHIDTCKQDFFISHSNAYASPKVLFVIDFDPVLFKRFSGYSLTRNKFFCKCTIISSFRST